MIQFINTFEKQRLIACLVGLAALLGLAVTAHAQDKVVIRGSNTVGEELAPQLIAEYKKAHPTTAFDIESKGTAYGIGALMGGYCDIAGASKKIGKEQEEIAQMRGVHFKEYVIGSYSVAIIVNAANPISNLSSNQVQDLFTGKVQNWKEVGGPDAPVHLIVRDPVSGTYLGFKEIAMAFQDYAEKVQLFTNYSGIAQAVAKDAHAIGYVGFDSAAHAGVKTLSIEGVAPSIGTINAQKYPYQRTLRLYTNEDKESEAAKSFIDFVLSPEGQKVVAQVGDVPKS